MNNKTKIELQKKQALKELKTLLYYMHFDNTKYHVFTIQNHYQLKIHQLINYNSCQLFDKVESLKKSKVITFNDIFFDNNALHELAINVIKVLSLFDNNKIEYNLTKFDNGKIGYNTTIKQ